MAGPVPELPQMSGGVFLTDGGVETDLIFRRGIELPEFASFVVHDDPALEAVAAEYLSDYIEIATDHDVGLILETLTWRASRDWGSKLGYSSDDLEIANRRAVAFLQDLRQRHPDLQVVISGCVGPRDDAYTGMGSMDPDEAAEYHAEQIAVLVDSGVDLVTALTLTNTDEATGIAGAAASHGASVVLSFTVETDGRLPSGPTLGEAIRAVDEATDGGPAYYMVNCAHPDHFLGVLDEADPAMSRLRGARANASRLSHAELDEAATLDAGDPDEFGRQMAALHSPWLGLNVLGGCCGTDARHIAALASSLDRNG
jgi:S-methylmethionine-dependent homocysteine/selenocysteine methylase